MFDTLSDEYSASRFEDSFSSFHESTENLSEAERYLRNVTVIMVRDVQNNTSRRLVGKMVYCTVAKDVQKLTHGITYLENPFGCRTIKRNDPLRANNRWNREWLDVLSHLESRIVPTQYLEALPEELLVENIHDSEDEFHASKRLLSAWIEGLNASRVEAGEKTISTDTALNNPQYFFELERNIDKIITNFGRLKAYDGGNYHLTFGGKLLTSVENIFVEHLLLPPRFAVKFLDELLEQLLIQSKKGPVFRGEWGELVLDERNELILKLVRRKPTTLAQLLKG